MSANSDSANIRKIISGPPGSGKTRHLIDLFLQAVDSGVEDRVIFLVPDSVAREHVRDLLASQSPKAFSDSGVHSIHSLISKSGGRPSVTSSHLRLFIRDLIETKKAGNDQLRILETNGGISLLEAAVIQLRRLGHAGIDVAAQSPPLIKLLDETLGYWDKWLADNNKIDSLGVLNRALSAADNESCELLLIDGFTEIQPLEWNIVKVLIDNSNETVATIDPGQRPSEVLLEKFIEIGFSVEESTRDLGICDDLRWLGDVVTWGIESVKPESCPTTLSSDRLKIIQAANPQIEASIVVREVARSIGNGYTYSDIALIAPNLRAMASVLKAEFERANIPVRFYVDTPLTETAPGALTSAFLTLLKNNWTSDAVLKLISNPFCGVESETAERVIASVKSEYSPESKAEWLTEISSADIEILQSINELSAHSKSKPSDFAQEIIEILETLIAKTWRNSSDTITSDEGWAWKEIRNVLSNSSSVFDEFTDGESAEIIAGFLLEELNDAKGRPFDRRANCVNAVTMLDSRTWRVPVAIVIGLSANHFPHRQKENPLLPDSLRKNLTPPLPDYDELRQREESMFRIALTRARDHLLLTWPSGNMSGTPNRISQPLARLIEWVECETGDDPVERVNHNPPISYEKSILLSDFIAIGYENDVIDSEAIEFLRDEFGLDPGAVVYSSQFENSEFKKHPNPESFVLGDDNRPISPSQLNKLAQCPYEFFASKVLGLKSYNRDSVSSGFDHMLHGNVAHDSLQKWFEDGKKGDFRKIVTDIVNENTRIPKDTVTEAKVEQIIDSLERLRNFEEKYIKPLGFEQQYGEYVPDTAKIKLADESVLTLGGRIDRIDVKDSTAIVADYKRSAPTDSKKLINALDFQLAAYILLVQKGLKLDVAIACFLPLMKLAKEGAGKVIYDPDLSGGFDRKQFKIDKNLEINLHIESILEKILMMASRFKTGDITPDPTDPGLCRKSCGYADLCRYKFSGLEIADNGGDGNG